MMKIVKSMIVTPITIKILNYGKNKGCDKSKYKCIFEKFKNNYNYGNNDRNKCNEKNND